MIAPAARSGCSLPDQDTFDQIWPEAGAGLD